MKKKWVMFVICLFFGCCGVHKFIEKKYKAGVLYLCTLGLIGIGWIVDLYKYATMNEYEDTILPKIAKEKLDNNELPEIQVTNLILRDGEYCCYIDSGYTFKDKTRVEGYSGKNAGVSIKLSKNLTYRTGGGESKAIRSTYREINQGYLYITNKRIIFTAEKSAFDIELDKVSAIMETIDGIRIQKASNTYSIIVKTHKELMKAFNLAREKYISV